MISTDITGNNTGASQLLDLLSLVSNPQVYEAKVKALQELTDKNQKYVEAVGPVSEIVELREKTAADRKAAAKVLADAKVESARIVAEAKETAAGITKDAADDAKNKKAATDKLAAAAKKRSAQLESQGKALANREAEVEEQKTQLAAALAEAESSKTALDKAKAEVDAIRAELRKKLDAIAKAADV